MDKIQIKCHACGQKFSVSESYMGRIVECGTCDQTFEVNEDALAKQRKFYPGERTNKPSQTFAKSIPSSNADGTNVNFQTANYNEVNVKYAQPQKPIRTLMAAAGILIIIMFIVLFLIGGQENGILKNLENSKRLILAGFIAFISSVLILLGIRNKAKGALLSLILGGGLIAIPFILPKADSAIISQKPTHAPPSHTSIVSQPSEHTLFLEQLETYKKNIGFDKIEGLRKTEANPNKVKAILLKGSKVQYLDSILPYLERVLSLNTAPVTYQYGREIDGKPVTLLSMTTDTPFHELYEITKRFGVPAEMNDILSALKVIEVQVDKTTLTPPPEGATTDPLHPEYFNVNYLELKSIDRSRQINAAKRLESGEYLGRQTDISRLLADLITTKDHELSTQFVATLNNWTRPEYNTDEQVLNYAKEIAGTQHMSRPVMDYLIDKNVPGSVQILSKQWAAPQGELLWENHLVKAKERGEEAVIKALPSLSDSHYKSAASILSKIGTSRSIPFINNAISKANKEDKKYLKAVVDEIKTRQ